MAETVAIIGSGLVGRAWAICFARAGHEVRLWDAQAGAAAAALDALPGALEDLRQSGLLDEPTDAVLARVGVCDTLDAALDGAGHVQENTPEVLETKRKVFARLDAAAAPGTVLASSTSALLPSDIFEGLAGAARCLVAHPINPPHLIPAVEIVPGPATDPGTVTRTAGLMRGAGQAPIVMAAEIGGFVVNRLQGALLDEAFRLVEGGHASAEDVDIALRDGLALRWSFMGPFETIDLNAPGGVRDYVTRYAGIYDRLNLGATGRADWHGETLDRIEADRRAVLPEDRLAARHDWRDRRLMALLAHKKRMAAEE